jgi:hypothetical protein
MEIRTRKEIFQVLGRDPETGAVVEGLEVSRVLTATGLVEFLDRATGMDPRSLAAYAVEDENGRRQSAEQWMREHTVEHVLTVWGSDDVWTRGLRDVLLKSWPELHLALTSLAANQTTTSHVDPLFETQRQYWRAKLGRRMHEYRWDRWAGSENPIPAAWCGAELATKVMIGSAFGPVCKVCVKNRKAAEDAEA